MYTILINEDNSVTCTNKEAIMQRDKLVNKMCILSPKMYGEYDLSQFELSMTYKLPISNDVKFEILSLVDDNYKNDFLKYEFPIDTNITAENGDVEIQFLFMRTYLSEDGKNIQQVRNVFPTSIHICALSDWLVTSDSALGTLAELYLTNKNMMNGLEQLAATLYESKLDDLTIDASDKKLYGTSHGKKVGTGVNLKDLNDELVEVGGQTSGNIFIQRI